MHLPHHNLKAFIALACVMLTFAIIPARAQKFSPNTPLVARVIKTPDNALKVFHDAGMQPTAHTLTPAERAAVTKAFELMPPLHKRVLKEHLAGISFLDDMPNTALTSIIEGDDSIRRYHITFRAAILRQTISQWLTEKERTCFKNNDSLNNVELYAGNLNAIIYVLLHETTHVVDGALNIFGGAYPAFSKQFTEGVWADRITFAVQDSLLNKNRFRRGGSVYDFKEAKVVYQALKQIPFVSLYSTSSWSEDLAECLTVYHLTNKLKQPFKLVLTKNGKADFVFEPLKSPAVTGRMKALGIFYNKG